jgi:hypothetical protein
MVGIKSDPKAAEEELAHGIPMFLNQLIETLVLEHESGFAGSAVEDGDGCGNSSSGLGATAALHGADLYRAGSTIGTLSAITAMSARPSQVWPSRRGRRFRLMNSEHLIVASTTQSPAQSLSLRSTLLRWMMKVSKALILGLSRSRVN